jgi:hypothetical protein
LRRPTTIRSEGRSAGSASARRNQTRPRGGGPWGNQGFARVLPARAADGALRHDPHGAVRAAHDEPRYLVETEEDAEGSRKSRHSVVLTTRRRRESFPESGQALWSAVVRTQVAIVGAGPAGLLLGHLLRLRGVESVVLEARSREYVEQRIRAGVLEQRTVDLLAESEVDGRLRREGLVHHGIELRFGGRGHRIPLSELTGGRAITIYGQQEVVKDLIAARLAADALLLFEVDDVRLHDLETDRPSVRFRCDGEAALLECDFVAGCDGFHGVCRTAIPAARLTVHGREYPFAWLGILAAVAPSSEELVYAYHERGFALHSMRSRQVTRLYLQCAPDEDLTEWPDARIW